MPLGLRVWIFFGPSTLAPFTLQASSGGAVSSAADLEPVLSELTFAELLIWLGLLIMRGVEGSSR